MMKKLGILVMAMVLVFGLSFGVLADVKGDTSSNFGVKAVLEEYVSTNWDLNTTEVREYDYSNNTYGNKYISDPDADYLAHNNVTITANGNFKVDFSSNGFGVDDITFGNIQMAYMPEGEYRSTTKPGVYKYSVFLPVNYDLDDSNPTSPGTYTSTVTMTISSSE